VLRDQLGRQVVVELISVHAAPSGHYIRLGA
jgi:hypothetical protein